MCTTPRVLLVGLFFTWVKINCLLRGLFDFRHQPGTKTVKCICPPGFNGPRCEQSDAYFTSPGFAWAPAIGSCSQLHIRLAVYALPTSQTGLLLYAGPINYQSQMLDDFIGLQMEGISGQNMKLVYNLGSGPVTGLANLPTESRLNDGNWHQIDIILTQVLVRNHTLLLQTQGNEITRALFALTHGLGIE